MSKNKICLRVVGGLGNQLFAYAYARSLAECSNRVLLLDTFSGYIRDNYGRIARASYFLRSFNLASFQLIVQFFITKKFPRFSKIFLRAVFFKEQSSRTLSDFKVEELPKFNCVFIEGYFQSFSYFQDFQDLIRHEIVLKPSLNARAVEYHTLITNNPSVSIHVRRAAYDNLLEIDYYKKAIDAINSKVASPLFFIFSDDIAWCEANFQFLKFKVFVKNAGQDEITDLWLMSECKHHVIANSSFSWWGAWLSNSNEKLVYAPFNTNIGVKDLLYPKEWILI